MKRLLCWIGLHAWLNVWDAHGKPMNIGPHGLDTNGYTALGRRCSRCGKEVA